LQLFAVTMGILFGPKLFGFLAVAFNSRRLRETGGVLFPLSFALEIVVSALIAPTMMLIHCGLVADILRGRDAGWRPQRRDDDSLPWSQVFHRHRWHMVAGVGLGLIAYNISWQMLAWISPAAGAMILAVPVSKLTGSARVGRWVKRLRLLRTPEEARAPAIARAAEAAFPLYREAIARTPELTAIARDLTLLERHLALTDQHPSSEPGREVDALEVLAEKKIQDALTVEAAVESLNPQEKARVQARPALLRMLARLATRSRPRIAK